MTSALAQKRSHVLPQDVSTVLDFLAQDIQELHALEKKSLTRVHWHRFHRHSVSVSLGLADTDTECRWNRCQCGQCSSGLTDDRKVTVLQYLHWNCLSLVGSSRLICHIDIQVDLLYHHWFTPNTPHSHPHPHIHTHNQDHFEYLRSQNCLMRPLSKVETRRNLLHNPKSNDLYYNS